MCTSVHCLRSTLVCVIFYIYHLHVKAVGNMDSHYQIHTYIYGTHPHLGLFSEQIGLQN